jgi:hypothetical protein
VIFGEGFGQGLREGRKLRCVIPGGSSTPVFTADVANSANARRSPKSLLGNASGSRNTRSATYSAVHGPIPGTAQRAADQEAMANVGLVKVL